MTRIENEMQYNSAMQRIEQLLKTVKEETPENDINSVELVLLSNLVADYEDEHYPINKPSLIEILKLRMFEMGLSQSAGCSPGNESIQSKRDYFRKMRAHLKASPHHLTKTVHQPRHCAGSLSG